MHAFFDSVGSLVFTKFTKWILFLLQTHRGCDKQKRKHYLDLTVIKHKADAHDVGTGLILSGRLYWQNILSKSDHMKHKEACITEKRTEQEKQLVLMRVCCSTHFLSPPHSSSCLRRRRSAGRCCDDCQWH